MKKVSLSERFQIGQLARSKQGRDKGRLYVIVGKDSRFLYAADGIKWTAASPKKKNAVHLQIINETAVHHDKIMDDSEIVRAIRTFESKGE